MAQLRVPNSGLNKAEDEVLTADLYVCAMPVDPLKAMLPAAWKQMEYFQKLGVVRSAGD